MSAGRIRYSTSVTRENRNMRSIQVFGKEVAGWQVLPADAPDLEEAALRACEFMSPGILESARGRGRRGALRSGTKKALKSLKRAKASTAPRKVARGREEQNPDFSVVRCLMVRLRCRSLWPLALIAAWFSCDK